MIVILETLMLGLRTVIFERQNYREILRLEFEERQNLNARFSLRAFASKVGLSASSLSEILNGKQGLSKAKAQNICKKLGYSKIEADYFSDLVEKESSRSKVSKERAQKRIEALLSFKEKQMSLGHWDLISKWYFPAILELSKTKSFKNDPQWISQRLGVSESEIKEALTKLLSLGLLEKANGKLKATGQWLLFSPNEVPSKSIKRVHCEILQKALRGMFLQPLEKRNYNALMIPIREESIPKAKKMIQDFNKKFNSLFESPGSASSVYCFSSQFFCLEESLGEKI